MKNLGLLVLSMFVLSAVSAQELLTPEKLWELKRVSGGTVSPDGNYLLYTVKEYDVSKNSGNTDVYTIDMRNSTPTRITETPFSEMEVQWAPDNTIWFMSTESNGLQIWKMNPDGTAKKCVSDFRNTSIEGFRIAPDGSGIITLQAVEVRKKVNEVYSDLPMANVRIEDDLMYRHWDHWDDYQKRHVFYHAISGEKVQSEGKDLQEGEIYDGVIPPFGGLDQVTWSNDSKHIVYAAKKKTGKAFALSTDSELYAVEINTGKTSCLTASGYNGYDTHPSYSVNGDLAWLSMERDGFEADKNDLIVRFQNASGDVNLTKSLDVSVTQFCWHPDGTRLLFLAAINGTVQVFQVSVSGTIVQLTSGMHDYLSLDASGQYIFAGRQSMLEPADLYAFKTKMNRKGNIELTEVRLTNANEALMSTLAKPTVQEKWIQTTDGKKMLVWMILPPDFDENKKYPTLLYCQGGPQSPVSQFFSYRWNFMLMASQGYVVVAPNRRGLPGFGQEWNDAISKDWGGQAMQDYLAAIDTACTYSYVDKDRLGAIGASYGGYSVYYLAGIHQKRFKTFIAHCGLFNLESWYGTTEELFFANWDIGGPYWKQQNKSFYEKNSPHRYVQNWDTPIFVIHGGMDFRVPESEGMQAFQAAQLLGLKSKYMYFPEEGHWVLSPQNGLVWHREFFKWLKEDLNP